MLKNYTLKLFAVLFLGGVSMGSVHALNQASTQTTIVEDNTDTRVEVLNENGIIAYFQEISKLNAPIYLEVLIENTKTSDIEISWEVIDKNGVVVISETSQIKANSTFRNVDSNNKVEILSGQPMSGFTFRIK